jgi:16S rRNA (uracil1498-N3)-methyltransferase
LISVLRASKGTEVEIIDGQGTVARGHVTGDDRKAARITVETSRSEKQKFRISLIQAALTGRSMDLIIGEACAIGTAEICILQAERSESKISDKIDGKFAHWNKLLIGACKQSGNPFLPKLSFASSINNLSFNDYELRFFGHIGTGAKHLVQALNSADKLRSIAVAIGPEGDFSEREREILFGENFIGCKLSDTVLRSETAAIYALSVINNHMCSIC